MAPFPFGYPNGKHYSLNLWNDVIFTTTSQGCAGNPNQMWAVNLKDPSHKVMTFNPKSGGLWGRSGAAIDSTGTAWAPTGDGRYDPANQVYGNGLIGAHVVGNELKLKDWFEPSNWIWLQKRDLDMQVTPAIFKYKGKELMVTGSKECRVYLLDTKSAGGENHQTPLYRTPMLCNEEVDFQSAGIWGSMASWEDSKGTRWALTPFWGPVASGIQGPDLTWPGKARRRSRVQSGREGRKTAVDTGLDVPRHGSGRAAGDCQRRRVRVRQRRKHAPGIRRTKDSPTSVRCASRPRPALFCMRSMPRPARSCTPAAIRSLRSSISARSRLPMDAYISARSTACCTASVFRAANHEGSQMRKSYCSVMSLDRVRVRGDSAGTSCRLAFLRRRCAPHRLGKKRRPNHQGQR